MRQRCDQGNDHDDNHQHSGANHQYIKSVDSPAAWPLHGLIARPQTDHSRSAFKLSALSNYILPDAPVAEVVAITDRLLTPVLLFDFSYRIFTTSSKRQYFFNNWGWADLLACVPMLRIFRVFRIVRATQLMRAFGLKNMINEVVNNRAGSALYLTIFAVIVLAETALIKCDCPNLHPH